jgi:hypothetical protein
MANATIQYQPNLVGVPVNIQKELEFLRSNTYQLLNRVNAVETSAATTQVGASSSGFVDADIPIPTGDAAGVIWTLSEAPNPPLSLLLFIGTIGSVSGTLLLGGTGIESAEGVANDYVLSKKTIIFTVAPTVTTQWVRAWYRT